MIRLDIFNKKTAILPKSSDVKLKGLKVKAYGSRLPKSLFIIDRCKKCSYLFVNLKIFARI